MSAKTIVLVHGLWMTPLSWEKWKGRFESKGYSVIAPAWPGLDGTVAEIRANLPNLDGKLSVDGILASYEKVIKALPEPPIIMGHSFGGLFTQILVDRGLGSCGVAISSAAAKGVLLLPFSTLKSSAAALSNPFNYHKVAMLTPEQFHYAFGNLLSEEESKAAYDRYAVPGYDHVLFQAALANLNPHAETTVNFKNADRAPLLFLTGEEDHISPPSVVEMNVNLYKKSTAVTDLQLFPNHSHFILGEPGWEEVADFALTWAEGHS